jgi:hypothetical protein
VSSPAKKSNDGGLLWFGVFTAVYGIRMILSADVFRFAATADPIERQLWRYPDYALTYMLLLPDALFLREVFPQWAPKLQTFSFSCSVDSRVLRLAPI